MSTPNASFSQQPPSFSATPKLQMVSPLRGISPALQKQFFINNMPPGKCDYWQHVKARYVQYSVFFLRYPIQTDKLFVQLIPNRSAKM